MQSITSRPSGTKRNPFSKTRRTDTPFSILLIACSYRTTAGREKQHACLTTDGVLGHFSAKRGKGERQYRQFVRWGIGKEPIWTDVKGQAILGEDEFVDGLIDYLGKHKDVPEIPKGQRYVSRPGLEKLFTKNILQIRKTRDGPV